MGKKKPKVVLPPELPPDVPEDDVDVSDEDLQFVNENREYAGFVLKLDTQSITRHVTRVADVKEDALESLYEKRLRKKSADNCHKEPGHEVDPVDALPVKTLDGKLYYRTAAKPLIATIENEAMGDEGNGGETGVMKLTKVEKRAKIKRAKNAARKKMEGTYEEEKQQSPQVDVLDEVQKDLTAEEVAENKKYRLAELGTALLTDPEANIKLLKEMLQISKDGDRAIVFLSLKSLLAVFKDVIPGYRIRLPTDKEQEMIVSKAVKKMRFYESTLLSVYKVYLQRLMALEPQAAFRRVAIRCICTLLEAVPHFNFRKSLLVAAVNNISSPDDVIRKLCCSTIKSLFVNEGKHGGEATVEAVQLIAGLVKAHDCQLHPDSIEVFMSLSFDEDHGKADLSIADNKLKKQKFSKSSKREELKKVSVSEKKKSRQELISKTREEVNTDFKAASFTPDVTERRKMQSETLSYMFQTYFRILKHSVQPRSGASSGVSGGASVGHSLLAQCLNGVGKFSHLIDLDFMADLMNYLRKLAGSKTDLDSFAENASYHLNVTERLRCCIVAFKVMRNNLDALNIDLQDFFVQLYNLVLEYRPGSDQGEVLAEALKIMLCDERQHDMQRAAAFVKRLATFSLCFGSAESMAALVALKHLLQKNVKCRNLLENDAGGGSLSGPIARYQPYSMDPNLSGALASVLWELSLLSKHYHPAVSSMASSIATMSATPDQVVLHSNISPPQAFAEMSLEKESFHQNKKSSIPNKRKRVSGAPSLADATSTPILDESQAKKKLSEYFLLIRGISNNERSKSELARTQMSLELYKAYKKKKKMKHG